MVKYLPANAGDTRDAGLIPGSEDSLEKEMATHSSILAWNAPWRGAWWATVHGIAKSWTQPSAHTYVQVIPEKTTTIHCAGGFTAVTGQAEMLGIQVSRWSA